MTAPKWTPAQTRAIEYKGQNLLLSAAAGSGKTATLTRRIVSLLTAPDSTAEISRILAVTYTRAAAAELKERVGKALREAIAECGGNSRLSRQLCDLGRAQITTIHAFCLHTLRPHFAELSLPAGFSVAESAEINTLSAEIMADTVSEFFDEGAADFLALADTLGSARNEAFLEKELLNLAAKLKEHGLDGGDLSRLAENLSAMTQFFASPAGAGTKTRVRRFAAHYCAYFADICEEFLADDVLSVKYYPSAKNDLDTAEALLAAADAGDYDRCRAVLNAYTAVNLLSVKADQKTPASIYFQEVHKKFKAEIESLRDHSFPMTEAETNETVRLTAESSKAAARVLGVFFDRIGERKRERGIVEFGDLERMTAALLTNADGSPTDAAREIAAAYDYIFIDEFQDTNDAQDRIFRAISAEGRRFMVGDIKQSIYRFRGAEPEVFAAYRRKWPTLAEDDEAPTDASHFMQENFRCDKPVIDFVNLVSRHLFTRCSIPFTEEDELRFAKKCEEGYTPAPIEIRLISKKGEETESEYVARRISDLLVHGRRADGAPITPRDIAILLKSPKTDADDFISALTARQIPVQEHAAGGLYEQAEIIYTVSILRALNNPGRDIDLAGAMRGPVFGFSLDDIVRIRRVCPKGSLWDAVRTAAGILPPDTDAEGADDALAARCLAFVEDITALRADARGMKTDELLLRLYRDTGMEEIAAAEDGRDAASVRKNLRAFYDLARRFEAGAGGGLYPFLRLVEEEIEAGEDGAEDDKSNSVRVMSIHHSKGLEFPVCFLCRADKGFNRKDSDAAVLFDTALGAVMKIADPSGIVRCDTPLRRSVSAAITDASKEEEMRVLYVALTRARERLIVTASVTNPEEMLGMVNITPVTPYFSEETVFSSPSYLKWILNALSEAKLKGEDISCISLCEAEACEDEAALPVTDGAKVIGEKDADAAEKTAQELRTRLNFSYPRAHLAAIPAKLTVSRLYPGILDEEDVPAAAPSVRNAPPAFLSGKTELEASFAGTATHVFLQFADFARLSAHGAEAERDRLLDAGFITREYADAVRLDEIARFTESDLFARLKNARRVWREFRFNAALPAAQFTEDESLAAALTKDGADVIVQGVMDLLFEDADGNIILADYKTDRLTEKEIASPALAAEKLIGRYKNQLSYYRAAASAMLGRDVDACLIYSLPLGSTVAVK